MSQEYIKFSNQEAYFSKHNLLNIQLGLLNCTKHLKEYRKLRLEEFALKLTFKKILTDAEDSLKALTRLLPESDLKITMKNNKIEKIEERLSLDEEIERIKAKLTSLKSNI